MTLVNADYGRDYKILSLGSGKVDLLHRLYSMGIQEGNTVRLMHVSAMGQTYSVKVLDGCVALRRDEAQDIELEEI